MLLKIFYLEYIRKSEKNEQKAMYAELGLDIKQMELKPHSIFNCCFSRQIYLEYFKAVDILMSIQLHGYTNI